MKKDKLLVNRYFSGVLYPEDPKYKEYLNAILENFTRVTWCTHTRDLDEEGNTKKEHTHIIFKVGENARHRKKIAEIIGIPENMIEGCNYKSQLLYLIHANNPEKTQYDISEVEGEGKRDLMILIQKSEEEENKARLLTEQIIYNNIKDVKSLILLAINLHCYTTLQRGSSLYTRLVKENASKSPEQAP